MHVQSQLVMASALIFTHLVNPAVVAAKSLAMTVYGSIPKPEVIVLHVVCTVLTAQATRMLITVKCH